MATACELLVSNQSWKLHPLIGSMKSVTGLPENSQVFLLYRSCELFRMNELFLPELPLTTIVSSYPSRARVPLRERFLSSWSGSHLDYFSCSANTKKAVLVRVSMGPSLKSLTFQSIITFQFSTFQATAFLCVI